MACVSLQQNVNYYKQYTQSKTKENIFPGQLIRENTLCNSCHKTCLRSRKCLSRIHVRSRKRAGEAIRFVEKIQNRCDNQGTDNASQKECNLLPPRGSSDHVACFKVLHIIV